MKQYLIDSNHLGVLLNPRAHIRSEFHHRRRTGDKFITCVPVLCEIDAGLASASNQMSAYQLLRRLAGFVRIWPLQPQINVVFGSNHLQLRRQRRTLSQIDMLLAAISKYHKLTLLTADRDFAALPDIKTENWIE